MSTPSWMPIGAGALAIGGRPGKRSYPGLERTGCNAILCLVSEKEGALDLRAAAAERGWDWHWIPLVGGEPPKPELDRQFRAQLDETLAAVRGGKRMYVHCAAGLHRTGMIIAALLLLAEGPKVDLEAKIRQLRPLTADELRADRVAWARRIERQNRVPG